MQGARKKVTAWRKKSGRFTSREARMAFLYLLPNNNDTMWRWNFDSFTMHSIMLLNKNSKINQPVAIH